MGSGNSGNYGNTKEKSQNYASSYHVTDGMHKLDINQGIYNDNVGYIKNPDAQNIDNLIKNDIILIDGKRKTVTWPYVLDLNNNLIIGPRVPKGDKSGSRHPHPELIGGKDPQVQCAGMIKIVNGKIDSIDNQSGHYKPPLKSLEKVKDYLSKYNDNLFTKNSILRKGDK